jgi:hypothetical protein
MEYVDEVLAAMPADGGWVTGRELRARLNAGQWWWSRWSAPGFYAMMSRLADVGLVQWGTEPVTVDGHVLELTTFRRVG